MFHYQVEGFKQPSKKTVLFCKAVWPTWIEGRSLCLILWHSVPKGLFLKKKKIVKESKKGPLINFVHISNFLIKVFSPTFLTSSLIPSLQNSHFSFLVYKHFFSQKIMLCKELFKGHFAHFEHDSTALCFAIAPPNIDLTALVFGHNSRHKMNTKTNRRRKA